MKVCLFGSLSDWEEKLSLVFGEIIEVFRLVKRWIDWLLKAAPPHSTRLIQFQPVLCPDRFTIPWRFWFYSKVPMVVAANKCDVGHSEATNKVFVKDNLFYNFSLILLNTNERLWERRLLQKYESLGNSCIRFQRLDFWKHHWSYYILIHKVRKCTFLNLDF